MWDDSDNLVHSGGTCIAPSEASRKVSLLVAQPHACALHLVSGVLRTKLIRAAGQWRGPEEITLMSCVVPACCLPGITRLAVCPTPSYFHGKGSNKQLIQLLHVKVREAFGGIVEVHVQLSHDGRLSSFMPDGQQAPETIR